MQKSRKKEKQAKMATSSLFFGETMQSLRLILDGIISGLFLSLRFLQFFINFVPYMKIPPAVRKSVPYILPLKFFPAKNLGNPKYGVATNVVS